MKSALAIFIASVLVCLTITVLVVGARDGKNEPDCPYNGSCNPGDNRAPSGGGQEPNELSGPAS